MAVVEYEGTSRRFRVVLSETELALLKDEIEDLDTEKHETVRGLAILIHREYERLD